MANELQTLTDIERSNSLNPVQQSRLATLREQGGAGNDFGIADSRLGEITDPNAFLGYNTKRANELYATANAPAISTMRESIPLTQQKFGAQRSALEGEREPLKQRYAGIIDELKRRETAETGQKGVALANEYGKRGIPLSSGLYENTLNQQTADTARYYGGQIKDVGFEQEGALRDILNRLSQNPIDEALQVNTINQGIAGLQSQSGRDAIQQAMALLNRQDTSRQQDLSNQMSRENLAATQKANEIAARAKTTGYEFASLGDKTTGYLYDPTTGTIKTQFGGGGGSTAGGAGGGGYLPPSSGFSGSTAPKPASFKSIGSSVNYPMGFVGPRLK